MKTMIALGVVLVITGTAWGRNEVIPLKDVPRAARAAADRAAPKAEWILAVKDQAGGYLLVGKDVDKQTVEFLTDAKGEKCAVRIEIPLKGVPTAVADALRTKLPGFEPKGVQACGPDAKTITVYRFQGDGYRGGSAGVYVSASGTRVTPLKD